MGRAHSNPAAGDNLSSPSLLLPPCVFPAFICLSHPALLPSCYLLTRSSLHCSVLWPPPPSNPPVCMCVCVCLSLHSRNIQQEEEKTIIITAARCCQPQPLLSPVKSQDTLLRFTLPHSSPLSLPSITSPLSLTRPS